MNVDVAVARFNNIFPILLEPIQTKRRIDHQFIIIYDDVQCLTNTEPSMVYLTSLHSNNNIKRKWKFDNIECKQKKRIEKKVNVHCSLTKTGN